MKVRGLGFMVEALGFRVAAKMLSKIVAKSTWDVH